MRRNRAGRIDRSGGGKENAPRPCAVAGLRQWGHHGNIPLQRGRVAARYPGQMQDNRIHAARPGSGQTEYPIEYHSLDRARPRWVATRLAGCSAHAARSNRPNRPPAPVTIRSTTSRVTPKKSPATTCGVIDPNGPHIMVRAPRKVHLPELCSTGAKDEVCQLPVRCPCGERL